MKNYKLLLTSIICFIAIYLIIAGKIQTYIKFSGSVFAEIFATIFLMIVAMIALYLVNWSKLIKGLN